MLSKTEAVKACLRQDRQLVNAPASRVVEAVKRQHRLNVSEKHVYDVRKAYQQEITQQELDRNKEKTVETNNGNDRTEQLPPTPTIPEFTQPAPDETVQPHSVTVVDFKSMDATMDFMRDLSNLAERCGGLGNVIVMAQKMVSMGVK